MDACHSSNMRPTNGHSSGPKPFSKMNFCQNKWRAPGSCKKQCDLTSINASAKSSAHAMRAITITITATQIKLSELYSPTVPENINLFVFLQPSNHYNMLYMNKYVPGPLPQADSNTAPTWPQHCPILILFWYQHGRKITFGCCWIAMALLFDYSFCYHVVAILFLFGWYLVPWFSYCYH